MNKRCLGQKDLFNVCFSAFFSPFRCFRQHQQDCSCFLFYFEMTLSSLIQQLQAHLCCFSGMWSKAFSVWVEAGATTGDPVTDQCTLGCSNIWQATGNRLLWQHCIAIILPSLASTVAPGFITSLACAEMQ